MSNVYSAKAIGFHRIGCKAAMQKHSNIVVLRQSRVTLEQIRDRSERGEEIEAINLAIEKINKEIDLYSRHTDRS